VFERFVFVLSVFEHFSDQDYPRLNNQKLSNIAHFTNGNPSRCSGGKP
jgi:hypothetical protein